MTTDELIQAEFPFDVPEDFPRLTVTETGCWIPARSQREPDHYVTATIYGRIDYLHRHAFRFFHGRLLKDEVVRHSCDVPACCCPLHLSKGTQADNVADRDERGRTARGERHGAAKLTREGARDIFLDRRSTAMELAARYEVDAATIRDIRNRKTWREATADLVIPDDGGDFRVAPQETAPHAALPETAR